MGITTDFTSFVEATIANQHSDLEFYAEVLDDNGDPRSTADFSAAEYVIADTKGNILITKTLNNGITKEPTRFVIKVDDSEMTMTGTFQHQFVVYNILGDRRPPVFLKPLRIKPTLRAQ